MSSTLTNSLEAEKLHHPIIVRERTVPSIPLQRVKSKKECVRNIYQCSPIFFMADLIIIFFSVNADAVLNLVNSSVDAQPFG